MSDANQFDATRNPQRQGNLDGPLLIIGDSGEELFIVRAGDEDNPDAEAQLYNLRVNKLLDQIKPIGIWLKFMYVPVEGVNPPVPFTPGAVALRWPDSRQQSGPEPRLRLRMMASKPC